MIFFMTMTMTIKIEVVTTYHLSHNVYRALSQTSNMSYGRGQKNVNLRTYQYYRVDRIHSISLDLRLSRFFCRSCNVPTFNL